MGPASAGRYSSPGGADTEEEKALASILKDCSCRSPRPCLLQASDPDSGIKGAHRKSHLVPGESGSKAVGPLQPLGEMDACADGSLQCIR